MLVLLGQMCSATAHGMWLLPSAWRFGGDQEKRPHSGQHFHMPFLLEEVSFFFSWFITSEFKNNGKKNQTRAGFCYPQLPIHSSVGELFQRLLSFPASLLCPDWCTSLAALSAGKTNVLKSISHGKRFSAYCFMKGLWTLWLRFWLFIYHFSSLARGNQCAWPGENDADAEAAPPHAALQGWVSSWLWEQRRVIHLQALHFLLLLTCCQTPLTSQHCSG